MATVTESPVGQRTTTPARTPRESLGTPLEVSGSRHFKEWMAEQQVSLAFTTYQSGGLMMFGLQPNGQLSISEWLSNRCLGLWGDGQSFWLSTQYQLWRLENALPAGAKGAQFDRLYLPRVCFQTGDLDIHDIAVDDQGRVIFVNTLFGCLAMPSAQHNFCPVWKPPFISRLAAEDRCHLNGLAMEHGKPAYVTFVGATDVADGWRDHKRQGGAVMDIRTNETVAEGLSMPHSPRVYRDRLWLHDSGNGGFGYVDLKSGKFEQIAFCPGYLRGLSFVDRYAVVGLSMPRDRVSFSGLALQEKLQAKQITGRCGLYVIDLESGDTVHWLQMNGAISELYDVVVLPGTQRPQVLDHRSHDKGVLSIGPSISL